MNATTKTVLVNELATLRAAIGARKSTVDALVSKRFDLECSFYDHLGFEVIEAPEMSGAWVELCEQIDSLNDESGYFWAISRMRDLEMILEAGRLVIEPTASWSTAHVIGIGDMPKADASVGPWLCAVFGFALAA